MKTKENHCDEEVIELLAIEKAEEVATDFEASKASKVNPKIEFINKGYKLLEEGKFDEMEAKIFLEGEKIRKQGKVVKPYDISKLIGIDEDTAKEIMWSVAKKVAHA